MITAENLSKSFGSHEALRGVNLTIAKGEMFALIGPDGAGKSTFFRIATGLIKPTSGTMKNDRLKSQGFVPQRFALYTDLSIDENLALRAQFYGVDREGREEPRGRPAVACRAGSFRFAARRSVVRRDEAEAGVVGGAPHRAVVAAARRADDRRRPPLRREFWMTLHQLHHDGLTIVVSTPYMDEASYATRIGFLDRGRLLATGTRQELIRSYPRTLVEVRSSDRQAVRPRLSQVPQIDDVSLFGTVLHVRGAAGVGSELVGIVQQTLAGLVAPDAIAAIEPSLEDIFVLNGDAADQAAEERAA